MIEESPKPTSAHDVFVSYASQNAEIADAIVATLEKSGIKCWIAPRDVTPGALYADGIIRAINEAKVLVLVLSANSIASKHVGKEVERASSKGRPIIALKVDTSPLTTALEYFLSESQWIDAAALGMPAALEKLAQAVGKVLASPEPAIPGGGGLAAPGYSSTGRSPKSSKVVALAAAIVVGLGVLVGVAVHFWPSKGTAPTVATISDKSIAVLPFTDMSQKKDQEYFGDGMAEEILDLLAKIPGLTVIGRTSSFQFKGKNEDLRKIGTELNAAYVLEGSVRNSGDQVRITAQLINTKTGAHEWSETYDRPLGDVLQLQASIAAAVARELQLTVAPDHLSPHTTLQTAVVNDLYLRGRHAFDRHDAEGVDDAARLFQQALNRDPTFVDAAIWLAWATILQGQAGVLAPADAYAAARRATITALTLDPNNSHAHAALGQIHIEYDWDWAAAERESNQAATFAPSSTAALWIGTLVSSTLGRWDDALRQVRALIAQDPLVS